PPAIPLKIPSAEYSRVSYTIDGQAGIAHVSGTIDPDTLMKLLAQSGKHAELLRDDSGYKHQNGHGYGQSYYNNHDYGYYNPNGTGSYHATTYRYHHQLVPNYYEPKAPPLSFPQPPPWREIHPFYNPDTQYTIM
ncbi:hypothetical protein PRUPE_1G586300, partial [Prunus persica]